MFFKINEFSVAILLHTNNVIEDFYRENKFVAVNSDGTMKKLEEKIGDVKVIVLVIFNHFVFTEQEEEKKSAMSEEDK